ncbi:MAG: transcriptional regulator [Sneathiella sp.]|nr:MAG: transcriptional regulator [Sneathiella sp.]
MTTRNYRRQDCPIAFALSIVGDQWTILLIRDVLSGTNRFDDLQKRLGISRNLLTRRLKQLVADGILIKRQLPNSRRHAYWPTPKCTALRPSILALAEWGQSWRGDAGGTRVEITETDSGRAVGVRFCRLDDGQEVSPARITVKRISG